MNLHDLLSVEDVDVIEEEFETIEMCTACNGTSCSVTETGAQSTEEELLELIA